MCLQLAWSEPTTWRLFPRKPRSSGVQVLPAFASVAKGPSAGRHRIVQNCFQKGSLVPQGQQPSPPRSEWGLLCVVAQCLSVWRLQALLKAFPALGTGQRDEAAQEAIKAEAQRFPEWTSGGPGLLSE